MTAVVLLANALYSEVEVRGPPGLVPGILVNINVEDGTVDVQTAYGLLQGLKPFGWATKDEPVTWQWPNAPDPLDPETFVPTHRFRHERLEHPVPPRPPTPPKRSA